MALLGSLTVALATGVAKHLIKQVLPKEWQDQISEELVDLGMGWLTGGQSSDPVAEAIGKRVEAVYAHSSLAKNQKLAVLREVTITLARAKTEPVDLVKVEFNSTRLQQLLLQSRPQATSLLSSDEVALYGRMLGVASEGIIGASEQMAGFLQAVGGALLRGQRDQADQLAQIATLQEQLWMGWAKWLAEPEEKAQRFKGVYCNSLVERLDVMEPFGIPERDEIGRKLKLQVAFIKLKLTPRQFPWRYRLSPQRLLITFRDLFYEGKVEDLSEVTGLVNWYKHYSLLSNLPESAEPSLAKEQLTEYIKNYWLETAARVSSHSDIWKSVLSCDFMLPGLWNASNKPFKEIEDVLLRCVQHEPITENVSFDQALTSERRIMIEGPAGSGKSTLLQWIAVQAAQNSFPETMKEWNGLVPFFIRLRRCREGGFPAPEKWPALEAKSVAGSMPIGWVHEQLKSGRALVLVDGIDEMPQKQRGDLLEEMQSLVKNYPLARYIVTSRPTAVNEEQWPEWREWLIDSGFTEASLKEMDGIQLEEFVDQWHKALRESVRSDEQKSQATQNAGKLKQLLRRRDDLRQLATTPLLAAMVCALYQERGDRIPRERLKLYEECVEMLLERREEKKGVDLDEDYVNLSYYQKIVLLRALAYWMLDNEVSAIASEDADTQFTIRLPALDLPRVTGTAVRHLFVDRIGLLQEAIVDEVSFRHRTFQEFLAAKEAVHYNNIGALIRNARNDQWRETIILAAGLATAKEQEKLLRGLIKKAKEWKRKPYQHQVLLLALACLETCTELSPTVRVEVMSAAREVFPPHSREEVAQVAKAGSKAVELLQHDPDYPDHIAVCCIEALAAIGGEHALSAIARYIENKRAIVQQAIGDAWNQFEAQSYVDQVLLAEREELRISRFPIHPNWIELLPRLISLSLRGTSVKDLTPLQGLSQLTYLDLGGTEVNDLTPLQGLSQLTYLDLEGTQVNDLTPLQGLSQLTSLDLSGTQVNDLTPLQGLSQLTSLHLSGTQVNDLTPLQGLSQLTSLDLRLTQVNDLTPLQGLSQLNSLALFETPVNDLTPLQGLSQLTSLDLEGTEVNDLTPLQGLSQLTSLDLGGTQVNDLTPLQGLSQLTSLYLSGTQINHLAPLQWLSQLTSLHLSGTQVSDLTPLQGLSQLTSLHLSGTQVNDLTPLQGLSQLTSLSLVQTPANDLTPLQGLSQLTSLFLFETPVSDLTPLQGLSQLTSLFLFGAPVKDLTPLQGLSQLTSLDLRRILVNDLTPLQGLFQLTSLDLSGTEVNDLTPLQGLSQLTSLDLSGTEVNDLTPLQGLSQLTSLNLGGTQVNDLTPLQGLSQLTSLYLSGTQINHLASLQWLSQLTSLFLDKKQVTRFLSDLVVMERQCGLVVYKLEDNRMEIYRFLPVTAV